MVAEGLPLAAITQTQLRLRLGGGSWQALREELERAQAEAAGPPMPGTGQRPAEHLASIARLLDEARRELTGMVAALETELRCCRQEVQRLRDERDSLRHELAGLRRLTSPAPGTSPTPEPHAEAGTVPAPPSKRRRPGRKAG